MKLNYPICYLNHKLFTSRKTLAYAYQVVAWIISGASFAKKWYDVETDTRAVIISEEADILSGPEIGDTVLFKLHEGAIVDFEREESGWYLISLPDEKRGWIKSGDAGFVRKELSDF